MLFLKQLGLKIEVHVAIYTTSQTKVDTSHITVDQESMTLICVLTSTPRATKFCESN